MSLWADKSGAEHAAIAFEIALMLAGLWLAWALVLGPGARRPAPALLGEWRIRGLDFAFFLLAGLAGAAVLGQAAAYVLQRAHADADAATVAASGVQEAGFLVGFALFYALNPRGSPAAGPRPGAGAALRGGVATFLIALPLVGAVNVLWGLLLTRMGMPVEDQRLVDILENTHSATLRWSFVAIAGVLAPAAEEFLFRGALFRYFRTRIPRWLAIAATSAVFGALHVQWSGSLEGLPSLAPLVVLASLFCISYERTGTLAAPIIAHALFNLNMMVLIITGVAR